MNLSFMILNPLLRVIDNVQFLFIFLFSFIFSDAAFLRDFSDGFGLDDENLIEIVCTRSNAELSVSYFHF
jgi:uncharacterized iron-regulated protein